MLLSPLLVQKFPQTTPLPKPIYAALYTLLVLSINSPDSRFTFSVLHACTEIAIPINNCKISLSFFKNKNSLPLAIISSAPTVKKYLDQS